MGKIKIIAYGSVMFFALSTSWAAVGKAVLQGTSEGSKLTGSIQMEDTKSGLKISVQIENAPPGHHGFHIHEFGDCGDGGKNAGGHYNPKGVSHGDYVHNGSKHAHKGDLGNIEIGKDGKGTLETHLPKITLSKGKYTVGGRAFILHENQDDFGQPTGNAGGRIGCGPILLIK